MGKNIPVHGTCSMADDSLATPVNKLPSVSTRDAPKSVTGDVSYADILKQQEMERYQFDQQQSQNQNAPVQPQFQEPIETTANQYYDDMRQPLPEPMQQPMMQQPMMQQPMMQQPMMQQPMMQQPDVSPRPETPTVPGKKWWRVWLLENKVGWIVALVTFLLLTFIYPRIRGLQRFAGMPLPYWATGGMSVAGAAMVTAIHMSV
jgi:hypothetical protein